MGGEPSLKELVEAALLIVVLIGVIALFTLTDFDSVQQSSNNLSRFIWAVTHIAVPTTRFAVYFEMALAVVGGITIERIDARATIIGGFALYFFINFVDAWFAAPV
ncbi:hypothetical protein [Halorubrum sp. AJ67]|uniref:hypothetical protein n=1 Tax=Halorubrum sp. AJ67 TaxID=1173487 RepID=UPI0003DBBF95|nr:hypothetical protein [Halorubrum sp. AJ67]CDK40122.1 putative membrane protein [Halorubrum sp. AJ67]